MGLDMYLNRFPRHGENTAKELSAVESYLSWEEEPEEVKNKYTFEQWSGVKEDELPSDIVIDAFRSLYTQKFDFWDEDKAYPRDCISENVGYWRKANQIHNWFVQNVQDGVDDCEYHHEVTKEKLEQLRELCNELLSEVKLIPGQVVSGYRFVHDEAVPIMIDGLVMEDDSGCRRYLPTSEGFFFGDTNYDEYYIENLKQTVEICDKILAETDFENQMIYYISSW